jgi:hypothetical protein
VRHCRAHTTLFGIGLDGGCLAQLAADVNVNVQVIPYPL